MRQNWPERLWLVRHGQSQGNVARDAALAAGRKDIQLDVRDVDVPLSDLGLRQADAAGRWFADRPVTNGRRSSCLALPARPPDRRRHLRSRRAGGGRPRR